MSTATNTILSVAGDGSAIWRTFGANDNGVDLVLERAHVDSQGNQLRVQNGDILRYVTRVCRAPLPCVGCCFVLVKKYTL